MPQTIGKYRWTICALLFFATTVNYLDRQVLSLLQTDLAERFGWTNTNYADITAIFQFGYAISMLFAGRIIDRLNTKRGYAWAIVIWSIGAIIHALAIPIGEAVSAVLGFFGITALSVSVVGFMVSRAVLAFGESGNFPAAIKATAEYFPKVPWVRLLGYKQTWSFAFGKFMTDGVWWFFLFWLPAYLKAQYGMSKTEVAIPIAVLYSMTMIGSVGGGWFPVYYFRKGYSPYDGRMKAMLMIALIPLVVLLAQPLGGYSYWIPVSLIGIGASAHQAWSANIFTTVSDMFPKKAIASVVGIGGMAGGIGGVIMSKLGGWLFDSYKAAGIAESWIVAKANGLGDYLSTIRGMKLATKYGDAVNLDKIDLAGLSKEVAEQLKNMDAAAFDKLKEIQAPLVHSQMSISYTIMFAICALAYLVAWSVMKRLVPKYKVITDL